MSFKRWSIAVVFLVMFGLVGVSVFGTVTGIVLVLLIAAALVAPALILRDTADVPASPENNIGAGR